MFRQLTDSLLTALVLQTLVRVAVAQLEDAKRNPLQENGILSKTALSNWFQCRRLCWYFKPCLRFSFVKSAECGEENCVFHGNDSPADDLADGWHEGVASGDHLPLNHGCKARPCSDTQVCVPRSGRVKFFCADIGANPCVPNPCENGGTCGVAGDGGFKCTCPGLYTGYKCETEAWLNSTCTDSCKWNMTDCYSERCLCKDGYFFSHKQYACVESCPLLHDTYLRFEDYDLPGSDFLEKSGTTFDYCRQWCTDVQNCLMFVWYNGMCYLKDVTAQDRPLAWREKTGVTIHQKTCV